MKWLVNYPEDCKQRVVLNGPASSWKNISAGISQGSAFSILFLIYINDSPNGIKSICNFFVNHTSLFLKVRDKSCSAVELKNDLKIISNRATQWKMLFNHDPNKQAAEILFSKKKLKK